ncbi:hypothetical protein KUCAC02_029697 [Chaenocephalus aceratus]|nr:hypothetical protein KUCAC02_029697 [Chaenocephalus aceratus]
MIVFDRSQSLYASDDANVALFPGASGVFDSYDLTPRGHYEVTVRTMSRHQLQVTWANGFLSTPATASASSPAQRASAPKGHSKTFQREPGTSIPFHTLRPVGHKLHTDQNEKLVTLGVTRVLAIDGFCS